eukprot:m.156826 g.156826  ORF g.156826 m.156826 type:complete len:79 (-) comp31028_c2_seq2:107-343(-)
MGLVYQTAVLVEALDFLQTIELHYTCVYSGQSSVECSHLHPCMEIVCVTGDCPILVVGVGVASTLLYFIASILTMYVI